MDRYASGPGGALFAVTFAGVAVTAAQDFFELAAHASSRVAIEGIELGQITDVGDAAEEIIALSIHRGFTTTGSGGSAATPAKMQPWSAAKAAVSVCAVNNTTVAQDGTAAVLYRGSWKVQDRFQLGPMFGQGPAFLVEVSQRIVLRASAPADSLTVFGTMWFRELGKAPTS